MVEKAVAVEGVDEGGVERRVEELQALLTATPEALEAISNALRIDEAERGWRKIITNLQSLESVPVVGRIASGVADLLVGNLVVQRTEDLIARRVPPFAGPPSGTPTG